MKKLILTAAVIAMVATTVSAQKVGVQVGANFASMKMSVENSGITASIKTKSVAGLNLGVIFDTPIVTDVLNLNTGLIYSQTGCKLDLSDMTADFKMHNLMLPVNLSYTILKEGNIKPFVQAGPYLMYALSGKYTYDEGHGYSGSDKIIFSGDDKEMKRMDFGLNFGAGVDVNKLRFTVNYGLGLANTSYDDSYKQNNRVFSISAGYFF